MRALAFLVLISVIAVTRATAQNDSQEVSGCVADSTGAAVPGATVSARHLATGRLWRTESGGDGCYAIPHAATGAYEVTAEAAGFRLSVLPHVVVTSSARATVNLQLAADDGGELGAVSGTLLTQLPLISRSFVQSMALLPGVSTVNRSPLDLLGDCGPNNPQQSVNGSRRSPLSWNVDGADNKDNGGDGTAFVRVSLDAIAEFKLLAGSYGAEYGQNSGAIVNVALKSGTRDFHGSLYGLTDLGSTPVWSETWSRADILNFGATLGGPVFIPGRLNSSRDRLFFFASFDRLQWSPFHRLYAGEPTLEQRAGDFSTLAAPVTDPASSQPFAGNIIPPTRLNRNGVRLVANIPRPNIPNHPHPEFTLGYRVPSRSTQAVAKTDYQLSPKHRLSGHYIYDQFHQDAGQTSLSLYNRDVPGINATARWTWTPGARTLNAAQVSYSGNRINPHDFTPNPVFTNGVSRAVLGVSYPTVYGAAWEIPDIDLQGYWAPRVDARMWSNFQRVAGWRDDFSRVAGAHALKFGVLGMRSRKNETHTTQVNGQFDFWTGHPLSSGNVVADALLGNFGAYQEANGYAEGWYRFRQLEFYAQDQWKVLPRLTLELGVRAHYMQPQYSALLNQIVFDPAYFNPAQAVTVTPNGQIVPNSGDPANGLGAGGTGPSEAAAARWPGWNSASAQGLFRGLPKEIQNAKMPLAPRFGFAFDLTGKQRTVLRGGGGLYYERILGAPIFATVNNPPVVLQTTLSSGNIDNPAAGKPAPLLPQDVASYDPRAQIPSVAQYNLGIQHRLQRGTMFEVAYGGSSAWHLYRVVRLNQLPLGTMLGAAAGTAPNSLRPYRGLGNITQLTTSANANYNALRAQLRSELPGGGSMSVAYTWSRNITDATDYNAVPQDSYNLKSERGLSSYHRSHVLAGSYICPLPFPRNRRGWVGRALANWRLSGTASIETGLPFNIVAAGDPAAIAGTGGSLRPNVVADWRLSGRGAGAWFNTSAFQSPAAGTFGNLGRNVLIRPGQLNLDGAVQRGFRIHDRLNADFRFECYNALNHVNFWDIDGNMASSRFGQVYALTDRRTAGATLRLTF
jgi:hypothetical protein